MSTAVLVIDIQKALVNPAPQPYQATEVIECINNVTERARAQSIPVFFIQHECPDSILEYGSEGWQLPDALNKVDGDIVVRKTTPDSFLRTDLEEKLKALGVTKLVITGYASEFCVDTTVRRSAAQGYDVTLVADAHTTHNKEHATAKEIRAHHNATLPNISSFGSKITSVLSSDLSI